MRCSHCARCACACACACVRVRVVCYVCACVLCACCVLGVSGCAACAMCACMVVCVCVRFPVGAPHRLCACAVRVPPAIPRRETHPEAAVGSLVDGGEAQRRSAARPRTLCELMAESSSEAASAEAHGAGSGLAPPVACIPRMDIMSGSAAALSRPTPLPARFSSAPARLCSSVAGGCAGRGDRGAGRSPRRRRHDGDQSTDATQARRILRPSAHHSAPRAPSPRRGGPLLARKHRPAAAARRPGALPRVCLQRGRRRGTKMRKGIRPHTATALSASSPYPPARA
jgi:hypothetical protein